MADIDPLQYCRLIPLVISEVGCQLTYLSFLLRQQTFYPNKPSLQLELDFLEDDELQELHNKPDNSDELER